MVAILPAPRRLLACAFVLLLWVASGPLLAQERLRVLAWPGYADDDLVRQFERQSGAAVDVTFVDSDDALWDKISANQGGDYDVFAVNTAELQRYIDAGLATPIDVARIPNHARQLPRFRALAAIPGATRQGRVYAVPYTYSEMGLIYNRRTVKQPPQSMAAMWAPEYRGKVLAYNTSNHNFSVAALLLGAKNPFHLGDAELRQAARQLVRLRRNVLTFYTSPEEAVQLYMEHDVALVFANYGTQQVEALRAAGADIGYVIPREGALAWLDCWALTRGVRNRALAEQWIDFTLERDVSARLTARHGLANTVTASRASGPGDKIIWLEPLESHARRKALWDRILSGDPLESF
jgi:putative spermidine/putrescine transport system substrate-binding protein